MRALIFLRRRRVSLTPLHGPPSEVFGSRNLLQQDGARAASALRIHTGFFYFAAGESTERQAAGEITARMQSLRSRQDVDG